MEDKIRYLCGKIVAAAEDEDVLAIVYELREALHVHVERIRAKVSRYPVTSDRRRRITPICSICLGPVKIETGKADGRGLVAISNTLVVKTSRAS